MNGHVQFVEVKLELPNVTLPVLSSCSSTNSEVFSASRFLVFKALEALRKLGYDWFLRIADDSALSHPVSYDMFDRLSHTGKRYGFLDTVIDNEKCLGTLWATAEKLCSQETGENSCSSLFKIWPEGVVVMTSFSISHYSVWESSVFRQLTHITDNGLKTGEREATWSDASIQTVGMLISLKGDEVDLMKEIPYSVRMNNQEGLKVKEVDIAPSALSLNDALVTTMSSPSLPALTRMFQPQRFGWLGGDVAVSFALPSLQDASTNTKSITNSKGNDEITPQRYIWLFGDSLIGTSSSSRYNLFLTKLYYFTLTLYIYRRIEAEMVSNSVAVVTINPKETKLNDRIQSVNYFWQTNVQGSPAPIFDGTDFFRSFKRSLSINNTIFSEKNVKFWPFSAVSSYSVQYQIRVVVIGQLVQDFDDMRSIPEVVKHVMGVFSFFEVTSIAAVIQNPQDPPNMWQVTPVVLNFASKYSNRFRWYVFAIDCK